MAERFISYRPTLEDYWRGIILFGRNVASYKFALAQALLDLRPTEGQLIRLEELAEPYSRHLRRHLESADKQGTPQSSRFLDACRQANRGEIDEEALIDQTVRLGFNNVIDAFHIVARDEVPERFYVDERKSHGGIRATSALAELLGRDQSVNLPIETDARWRLVETAWELGLSPSLLAVSHDPETEALFVIDGARRRRSITGARDALSGYQKGHCFYCFRQFSLLDDEIPDVDHFFPFTLASAGVWPQSLADGVWNLVLACQGCNRGVAGKFDRVPTLRLVQRLSTRNEYLIESHHPLRDTLLAQTGRTDAARREFLNERHRGARALLIHEWEASEVGEPLF